MFWNRNKKNKNTNNSAEEQRPLAAARTLIDMRVRARRVGKNHRQHGR